MYRKFLGWLGDTLCGLIAYTLSRWLWEGKSKGVFESLLPELGTFAACFVLLKLALKGIGLTRKKPAS